MSSKTITVTTDAYHALSSLKTGGESFSEVILRVVKRRPLNDFFGILSEKTADRLERVIYDSRKARHEAKLQRLAREAH